MDRGLDFLFHYKIPSITTYSSPDQSASSETERVGSTDTFGYLAQSLDALKIPGPDGADRTNVQIVSKMAGEGDKRNVRFINYRGQRWNRTTQESDLRPYSVEIDRNLAHVDQDELEIDALVKWSRGVPMSRLDYKDFVYCKDLGKYSNNRLVILRRYSGPIGNQVFGVGLNEGYEPIATVVTWVDPEDETMFNMSFGENWKTKDRITIWSVLNDMLNKVNLSKVADKLGSWWMKDLNVQIMRQLGITGLDTVDFYGNPNIISSTAWRDPAEEGFSTDVQYTVRCTYVQRYINGIDPNIAMLDIIGNICRMATRDAVWQINAGFGIGVKSVVEKFLFRDTAGAVKMIIQAVVESIGQLVKVVINVLREATAAVASAVQGNTADLMSLAARGIGTLVRGLLAEHRYKLMAAISGSTGMPSGCWHLMVGNPKKPVISIGDVVVTGVDLSCNNVLGFDDWPTEITAEFKVTNARNMGAQDIESIWNAGQQRIYYKSVFQKDATVTSRVHENDKLVTKTEQVTDVGFETDTNADLNFTKLGGPLVDNATPDTLEGAIGNNTAAQTNQSKG